MSIMTLPTKKKRHLKKKVKIIGLMIIAVILIIIIFISINKISSWYSDNRKTQDLINELNDQVIVEEIEDNTNNELETEENDYLYYINYPLIKVEFDKLIEKNNETVGWVKVNNTNINYPFVHTSNNEYYLKHSLDKSVNNNGWVFLDYRNNTDLNDKNNILYAHALLNRTMFGTLSNVLKEDWYNNKDNHIIRISTPQENSLWKIFSVYTIKSESYYITTEFTTNEEYQQFLDTISKRSIHEFDSSLNINDKILTLSTCYHDGIRTVVHAKLIKKEAR